MRVRSNERLIIFWRQGKIIFCLSTQFFFSLPVLIIKLMRADACVSIVTDNRIRWTCIDQNGEYIYLKVKKSWCALNFYLNRREKCLHPTTAHFFFNYITASIVCVSSPLIQYRIVWLLPYSLLILEDKIIVISSLQVCVRLWTQQLYIYQRI